MTAPWLREMPKHWREIQLQYLARVETGSRDTVDAVSDGEFPFVVRSPTLQSIDSYSFDTEAILTAGDGAGTGEVFHHMTGKFEVHQRVYVMHKLRGMHGRFLYYYFSSEFGQTVAYGGAQSTVPSLRRPMLTGFPVAVPPLSEQRTIADYLDYETAQIDAFIAKNEELITLLTERRAVAINDLVWSGLSADTRRGPVGEALPHAPEHWLRVRNKQLYRERVGVSEDGEGELLTVSHITGVTPRSQKNVTMFEAESTVGYKLVEPGDLAINTMWAWMGALGVAREPGIASPSYGVYRRVGDLPYEPRYFDYIYRSAPYVAKMTVYSRGITESRLRLYPETFLRLPIVVPPLEEQRAIADRIESQSDQLDAAVATAKRGVELARERRAALISAAVTGRIDVGVAV